MNIVFRPSEVAKKPYGTSPHFELANDAAEDALHEFASNQWPEVPECNLEDENDSGRMTLTLWFDEEEDHAPFQSYVDALSAKAGITTIIPPFATWKK